MNEQKNDEAIAASGPSTTEIMAYLKKIEQQLQSLERKIDALNKPAPEKFFEKKSFQQKSFGEKRFSKPFRSFGPPRHGPKDHSQRDKKRDFSQGPRSDSHDASDRDQHRGFHHKKKPFFNKQKRRDG